MTVIQVSAERIIGAPAEAVYGYIADMREHHPRFLPPAFSEFEVVSGGIGAGTVTGFAITAGGRTRRYRMHIAEPDPGRVLTETDADSSLITTFAVTPQGDNCLVQIASRWDGARGIGGFFERTFAPRALRGIYAAELGQLDAYARARASA